MNQEQKIIEQLFELEQERDVLEDMRNTMCDCYEGKLPQEAFDLLDDIVKINRQMSYLEYDLKVLRG